MDTVVAALVVVGIGAAIGALAFRGRSGGGWRLAWIVGALLAFPFVLFGLANLFRSDVLGWMGGLSMIALLAAALPLGIGLALGAIWARWHRPAEPADGGPGPARPTQPPARLAAPDPQTLVERARVRALLVAMAGVMAAFWVAITVGFHVNGQSAPPPLDLGFLPALGVLIASLVLTARTFWRGWPGTATASRERPRSDAELDAERARYAHDPAARATCEHLAPVERAMRDAGIAMRWVGIGHVEAACRVDPAALGRWLLMPESVVLEEVAARERPASDPPAMRLRCQRCGSSIRTVHPRQAAPGTAAWPAG